MDSLVKAKQQLDLTDKLLSSFPNSRYSIKYYYNKGYYFQKTKNYESALMLYDKAISVAKIYQEDYMIQSAMFLKYAVYRSKEEYNRAVNILLNILNHNLYPTTNNRLTLYHEISDTYVLMKNMPEAYKWLNQYTELRDSLYMTGITDNMNELEAKYRTSEKEKHILLLQNQKSKAELSAKNNKLYAWLLGAGCLILLLAAIFSFILFNPSCYLVCKFIKGVSNNKHQYFQ